jgi:hypothetical protein
MTLDNIEFTRKVNKIWSNICTKKKKNWSNIIFIETNLKFSQTIRYREIHQTLKFYVLV